MSRSYFLLFLVTLLLPAAGMAQQPDKIPKPVPPFISPLADNTVSTIIVTNPDVTVKPTPGLRSINKLVITNSGTTREIASLYTDGSKTEVWFFKNYRIEQLSGSGYIMVTLLSRSGDTQNTDFPHLNWLALANYTGTESRNGKLCWHFKSEVKLEIQNLIVDYSAYIDTKTKRPVEWDFGSTHYELSSLEKKDSSNSLVLPEAFAAKLKEYQVSENMPNAYLKH